MLVGGRGVGGRVVCVVGGRLKPRPSTFPREPCPPLPTLLEAKVSQFLGASGSQSTAPPRGESPRTHAPSSPSSHKAKKQG